MLNMKKNSTPLFVTALALRDDTGRILLQKRRSGSVHGGLWEFPGGKIEHGESPESALVREIDEELGLCLRVSDLEPVTFASSDSVPDGGARPLVIFLYMCRTWNGEPRCLGGEEIAWCAPELIANLDMPPLDYPLAERLLRLLVPKD